MSFPSLAGRSAAYQVVVAGEANGIDVSFYADLFFLQRSRSVVFVATIEAFSPSDTMLEEKLVRALPSG